MDHDIGAVSEPKQECELEIAESSEKEEVALAEPHSRSEGTNAKANPVTGPLVDAPTALAFSVPDDQNGRRLALVAPIAAMATAVA